MQSTDDGQLLADIEQDPDAFEAFYRRHVDAVMRFAARRCQTSADVADVVSGTFLAVRTSASSFDSRRGTPRSWLFGIAAHEVATVQRRDVRERGTAQRMAGRALLEEEDCARLDDRIAAEQLAPRLSEALRRAPASEREIFLLVAYEDLTPSEAAQVLNISAVAARVRLTRVRRRLRNTVDLEPAPRAKPNLEGTS